MPNVYPSFPAAPRRGGRPTRHAALLAGSPVFMSSHVGSSSIHKRATVRTLPVPSMDKLQLQLQLHSIHAHIQFNEYISPRYPSPHSTNQLTNFAHHITTPALYRTGTNAFKQGKPRPGEPTETIRSVAQVTDQRGSWGSYPWPSVQSEHQPQPHISTHNASRNWRDPTNEAFIGGDNPGAKRRKRPRTREGLNYHPINSSRRKSILRAA